MNKLGKKSVEDITQYKKQCLEIIQKYLNPVVKQLSSETILEDCAFITQSHFDDLVDERSCADLCGYVLCDNLLSESKENKFKSNQIYSIKNGHLFDIKRRRLFCSDLCFKASDHLREQISTELLPVRKDAVKLELYQQNIGVRGDHIKLYPDPATKDGFVDALPSEAKKSAPKDNLIMTNKTKQDVLRKEKFIENKLSAPYVRDETFKKFKEKFQNLTIQEKNVHTDFETFMDSLDGKAPTAAPPKVVPEPEIPQSDVFSCDIKEKNIDVDHEKIKNETCASSTTTFSDASQFSTSSKHGKSRKRLFFMDMISKLKQWTTLETKQFLNCSVEDGEDEEPELPIPLANILKEETDQQRIERLRWEYIQLVAKLDLEEAEEERLDSEILAEGLGGDKKKKKPRKKSVRFADNDKEDVPSTPSTENPEEKTVEEEPRGDDEEEEERAPLYFPEKLAPSRQRVKMFLIEVGLVLNEFFDNHMDPYDLAQIRDRFQDLVDTFNFGLVPLAFDRNKTIIITIIILRAFVKYSVLDDSERFEQLFTNNPMITPIMEEFHLNNTILDKNLEKIWPK